jgi:enterochelin esterase-like enzyme
MPTQITRTTLDFIAPAGAVSLMGDFTDWDRFPALPVDPTTQRVSLEVPRNSWVEFAWLDAQGKPFADPEAAKTQNPWYAWARGVEVGTYARHPMLEGRLEGKSKLENTLEHQQGPHQTGTVHRHSWQGTVFAGTRRAYIYTPPHYDPQNQYPVYYVQDGVAFYRTGRLGEVLDHLLERGHIAPAVLVFLEPNDRNLEYYLNPLYPVFLETEVLPYIEAHFAVRRDAAGRGLWGASLGGLISLYTALERPELYSRVISHSGAFIAQHGAVTPQGKHDTTHAPESLLERITAHPPQHLQIALDCGTLEWLCGPNRRMAAALHDHKIPHQYLEYANGHNWVGWRNALPEALLYMQGI